MSLFNYDETADITRRNAELNNLYKGYSKVVFGGITLAVKAITPRVITRQIDNKSWLQNVDMGIKETVNTTTRTNSDGTKSYIETTRIANSDGSVTTITEERVTSQTETASSTSESYSVPLVDPDKAGLGKENNPWTEKLEKKVTTTVKTDNSTNTSIVTVRTEVDPENPKSRYEYTETFTDEQYKVEQAKPIVRRSITGKEFIQTIAPTPPQGTADYFWNDEMLITKSETQTDELDNNDGTITTTTTQRDVDARGYVKEVVTTSTVDKEPTDDSNTVVTKTVSNQSKETVTETVYDRDGVQVSQKTTETLKYDDVTGESTLSVVETEEVTTDELGKEVTKTTRSVFNPITGVETIEETEEITNVGADRVSYDRSIEKNFDTGVKTTTETINRTDGYGVTRTESATTRTPIDVNERVTTRETIYESKDDAIVDDIVNGWIITEYVISGDLMSQNQVEAIQKKHFEHQVAWAMLQVREEQLALGERLSPDKRRQLYKEWQEIFNGETDKKVLGGFTLDRIHLNAFGEEDVPVVFANGSDGFKIDWIDGAYGLWSWSMRLHKYERIVRDKSNSFATDNNGGFYGRSDNLHWQSGIGEFSSEIEDRKDVADGGQWPYV